MARIQPLEPRNAPDKSRQILLSLEKGLGFAPNLYKSLAHAPSVLEGFLGFGKALDAGSLPAKLREQIALARLGKQLALDGERTFSGTLVAGGETIALTPDRLHVRSLDHDELAAGVRFTAMSEAPVFGILDVAGIPRRPPAFDDSAISIVRSWHNPDGSPWKPGPLREGQVLVAALRIEAREAMPDALVVDRLAAGLEIENLNLSDPEQWSGVTINGITLSERGFAAELAHEEYRDDRYVAALKLYPGQAAHLFYLVRAVTPGTYALPPPQAEDMYRPELRGTGRASPATVTVGSR